MKESDSRQVEFRQVELRLSPEFLATLSESGVGSIDKRLTDAVGYLSLWGLGGRAVKVVIYGDRHGEMTARYTDQHGEDVFTIGAVPDESWVYSFHS